MDDDPAALGRSNGIEFCRESTRWGRGGQLYEPDGIVLFATGSWVPSNCNGAIRVDPSVDPTEVIARADSFFGDLSRGYDVVCAVGGRDDDLAVACERAGLQVYGAPEPQMLCTERPPELATAVDIRPVVTAADVAAFVSVQADAYAHGMPPGEVAAVFSRPHRLVGAPNVRAVVAYAEGRPVAGALLLLSHGVGGVYWVGTVASARRRGFGDHVTRAVTRLGFELGAGAVVLDASPEGLGVYERLGYREVGRTRRYVRLKPTRGRRRRR